MFPNSTPAIKLTVGEVALSQVDPLSVDLSMFPDTPTATNIPEPEEEEDDEDDEDEEDELSLVNTVEPTEVISPVFISKLLQSNL